MSLKGKSVQELPLHLVSLLEERGNGKKQLIPSCTNQPMGKCHKIMESLLGNVVKLSVILPSYKLTDFFFLSVKKISIHTNPCDSVI